MREHPNKSFGLRKRNGKKRQAKALGCRCEMTGNRQHTQSVSHLSGTKKLGEQLHLASPFTSEAREILCEANDVVILQMSQRSRRWMRCQILFRRKYAE